MKNLILSFKKWAFISQAVFPIVAMAGSHVFEWVPAHPESSFSQARAIHLMKRGSRNNSDADIIVAGHLFQERAVNKVAATFVVRLSAKGEVRWRSSLGQIELAGEHFLAETPEGDLLIVGKQPWRRISYTIPAIYLLDGETGGMLPVSYPELGSEFSSVAVDQDGSILVAVNQRPVGSLAPMIRKFRRKEKQLDGARGWDFSEVEWSYSYGSYERFDFLISTGEDQGWAFIASARDSATLFRMASNGGVLWRQDFTSDKFEGEVAYSVNDLTLVGRGEFMAAGSIRQEGELEKGWLVDLQDEPLGEKLPTHVKWNRTMPFGEPAKLKSAAVDTRGNLFVTGITLPSNGRPMPLMIKLDFPSGRKAIPLPVADRSLKASEFYSVRALDDGSLLLAGSRGADREDSIPFRTGYWVLRTTWDQLGKLLMGDRD